MTHRGPGNPAGSSEAALFSGQGGPWEMWGWGIENIWNIKDVFCPFHLVTETRDTHCTQTSQSPSIAITPSTAPHLHARTQMIGGSKESNEMSSPGGHPSAALTEEQISKLNARLANPLAGKTLEELQEMGARYARDNGMQEYEMEFRKGAMLAQDRDAFETVPLLTDGEREILRREVTHRWSHPMALYHMVIMCSVAASVQGMDESVINGGVFLRPPHRPPVGWTADMAPRSANLYFFDQFGIQDREWIKGLVNSAPYLCCFTIGCWYADTRSPISLSLRRTDALTQSPGSLIPSTRRSAVATPSSSPASSHSRPASGRPSPTRGGICSSPASSSASASAPNPAPFPSTPRNVPRQRYGRLPASSWRTDGLTQQREPDPRSAGHDVADVDGIRNHAGIRL